MEGPPKVRSPWEHRRAKALKKPGLHAKDKVTVLPKSHNLLIDQMVTSSGSEAVLCSKEEGRCLLIITKT